MTGKNDRESGGAAGAPSGDVPPAARTEPTIARGADTAIGTCLGVTAADRVVVFGDEPTRGIARALARAAQDRGAAVEVVWLEEVGERPLSEVPEALFGRLRSFAPTVSVFAAQGMPGEIRFRIPLGRMLNQELRTRHGHMIGISERLMLTGMQVDYQRVAKVTRTVFERVRTAHTIRVSNADGTDLVATFAANGPTWVPWTGIYHQQGDWGNLPEGETFTCPASVDGIVTVRLIGDHFSKAYGLLDDPMRIELDGGRIAEVTHPDRTLREAFLGHLRAAANGTRVGEFAIGTNVGLGAVTGNLLQDEKLPGVHMAFGDPYGHLTGADWSSDVHVDVIPFDVDVEVDGDVLMRAGRFVDVL